MLSSGERKIISINGAQVTIEENELCSLLHIIYKKIKIALNVKAKTIKLLEEKIGEYLYDLGLGNGFLFSYTVK